MGVWSLETKELATDNRRVREQLFCLQRILRKNRYSLDLGQVFKEQVTDGAQFGCRSEENRDFLRGSR